MESNDNIQKVSKGLEYFQVKNEDGEVMGYSVARGKCTSRNIVVPDYYRRLPVVAVVEKAFKNAKKLESIHLPDSITRIGKEAFSGCENLEKINFPQKVDIIEDSVFRDCESLEPILLPDHIKVIGDYAFSGSWMRFEKLPSSLTEIGCYGLAECDLDFEKFPEGLIEIGMGAFKDSICAFSTLPEGIKVIRPCLFEYSRFTADGPFIVPNTVTTIEFSAFYKSDLYAIVIPESVEEIADIFDECENIRSIYCEEKHLKTFNDLKIYTETYWEEDNGMWVNMYYHYLSHTISLYVRVSDDEANKEEDHYINHSWYKWVKTLYEEDIVL